MFDEILYKILNSFSTFMEKVKKECDPNFIFYYFRWVDID